MWVLRWGQTNMRGIVHEIVSEGIFFFFFIDKELYFSPPFYFILVADPRVARDKFVFDSVIILYY